MFLTVRVFAAGNDVTLQSSCSAIIALALDQRQHFADRVAVASGRRCMLLGVHTCNLLPLRRIVCGMELKPPADPGAASALDGAVA